MAQNAARLDRNLSALKKKINDEQRKAGKKPIDFDSESRKLARRMQRSMGKALNQAGIKSIDQFNKLMTPLLSEGLDKLKEKIQDQAPPSVSVVGNNFGTTKDDFSFLDDDLKDLTASNEKATASNAKDVNGTFDITPGSDISETEGDIFERISLRYQESAYPSLLKNKNTP